MDILRASVALVLVPALLAGCDSDPEKPNLPPDTRIVASPPHLGETRSDVAIFWTGTDPENALVGFEWSLYDHGSGDVPLGSGLPEDELEWQFTTATDSLFVVPADIVDDNPTGRPTAQRTWSFYVRAVDDRGAVDPTPGSVSFTAVTLCPEIRIVRPSWILQPDCRPVAPTMHFEWDADDPDDTGDGTLQVRTQLYPLEGPACAGAGVRPDAWGDWIDYDAPDGSGRTVGLPEGTEHGSQWFFAVQARDESGAISPIVSSDAGMMASVEVREGFEPELVIRDRFLGLHHLRGLTGSRQFTVTTHQPVHFEWSADPASYGGRLDGFRYGIDVLDPDDPDDPGWVTDWGDDPGHRNATLDTSTGGEMRNLVVEVRDDAGARTRAFFRIGIVPVPRRSEQRRLLLVDDHPHTPGVAGSEALDADWDLHWRQLIQGIGVSGFQSSDIVDAVQEPARLTATLVHDYRGVIWFIGPGDSYFRRNLAPVNSTTPRANWLESYQAFAGNVLFVGSGAMMSTLEDYSGAFPLVLDATGPSTLGHVTGVDGEPVPVGTLRYPWTGWCLSAIDMVRPFAIRGERLGERLRETRCSAIVYAGGTSEFFSAYDATPAEIGVLHPTDVRKYGSKRYYVPGGYDPTELNTMSLATEEFYDVNVTSAAVEIVPRECQTPMFRAVARRDVDEPSVFADERADGWGAYWGFGVGDALVDSLLVSTQAGIEWVDDCASQTGREGRATSPVSLQTIAVASGAYSGRGDEPPTKQQGTLLASDFLWGFNPLGFEQPGVRAALRWIVIDHWGVNSDF